MADDMGYGDLGCYGNQKIKTPNIDGLATEGIRFTNFYAGSTVCAPSRCTLMTGKHTGQAYIKGNFGLDSLGNLPIPKSEITVAEILKQRGYQTGVIGKWGLGGPKTEGGPNQQGFDYSYCFLDQRNAHEYYPPFIWENEEKVMLSNQPGENAYIHDLFTQKSVDFIRKNQEEPFFLYLPYTIPHGKYQVPDLGPYADREWNEKQKAYAAMITRMDRDVGEIMKLLKDLNLDEHTIVFFTSDNGAVSDTNLTDFFQSNGILRGYKRDLYEGGIRVPMIVRWPGTIEQGIISEHPAALWDFLPTAAEVAGADVSSAINGVSFLPELIGNSQPQNDYLFWEYFRYNYGWQPGDQRPRNFLSSQAVRKGNWKAVKNGLNQKSNPEIELFDLKTDPREQNNLANEHPEIVEEMNQIMQKAHRDTEFFKAKQENNN